MRSEGMRLLRTQAEVHSWILCKKLMRGEREKEKWNERKEGDQQRTMDRGEKKREIKDGVREGEIVEDIAMSAMLERKTVPPRALM